MGNFEYIIASLPFLTKDFRYAEGGGFPEVVSFIRENLSARDAAEMDFLLKGFDPEALTADFYTEALARKNAFLREYFRFDLNLRNAKVRYLNRALSREAGTDLVLEEAGGEFEEAPRVDAVLEGSDLLARERGLDDLLWGKVDELTTFHYFDLTAVLGYLAKLKIVDRWLTLDEAAGRELFRRLVDEVRGTFQGVHYEEK
jgi:hypothetical protein